MNANEARRITDEVNNSDKEMQIAIAHIRAAAKCGNNVANLSFIRNAVSVRAELQAMGYTCSKIVSFNDRDGIEWQFTVSW